MLNATDGAHSLFLGPSWCRDPRVAAGAHVTVVMESEGPQIASLADDFATALLAEPGARRTFESLASFYRNAYVRRVEDAKRPETRARRIKEVVSALKLGKREL